MGDKDYFNNLYDKCMSDGYVMRKSVKFVEFNIATNFFWRHKILECISTFLGEGYIDGVIEANEVFVAESFKGIKPSNMLKHSRKRGNRKEGLYYSQHINAMHSNLKKQMNDYIKWFKGLQIFDTDKGIGSYAK